MPMPNFHTCRIRNPDLYKKLRYAKNERDHNGKKYDVVYGQRKNNDKWEDQAFRYPKRTWTANQARTHCRQHKGKFEAASGRALIHSSTVVHPSPCPWSSIKEDRLPVEAFAGEVNGKLAYPHHWVRKGEICEVDKRYTSGEMFLHTAGLIEAIRKAKEDKAPDEIVQHLEAHKEEAGITIKEPGRQTPAAGTPKTTTMPEEGQLDLGGLPIFGQTDLHRIDVEIDYRAARESSDIEDWELEIINRIAMSDLKKQDIFTFPMWISNDKPDSYSTRMDPETTLVNFANDLVATRSLLKNHSIRQQVGSSFHGKKGSRPNHDGVWVQGNYYILRGVGLGEGLTTDDIIKTIRGGVYRRGSAGFTIRPMEGRPRGYYKCEICNEPFHSSDCPHLPGIEYEGGRICTVLVVGAGMLESSLAYMNAAQGTVIEKAQRMLEEGRITEKQGLELQMLYGVRFFGNEGDPVRSVAGATGKSAERKQEEGKATVGDQPKAGEKAPETEERQTRKRDRRKIMEFVRSILTEIATAIHGVMPKGETRRIVSEFLGEIEGAEQETDVRTAGARLKDALVTKYSDLQERVDTAEAIVGKLPEDSRTAEGMDKVLSQAKEGEAYRTSVVDAACVEGVRAEGEDFKKEHYHKLFAAHDIAFIQTQGEAWKRLADAGVKPGQKSKTDDGEPQVDKTEGRKASLPDKYFKTGSQQPVSG